jgi:hypothetical protein
LREFLAKARVSVIVVTPDNVKSPWVYHEAGWIAAKLETASVCPYLVNVPMNMLYGTPLADFQCTEAGKADTLQLVRALHTALGTPHDAGILDGNFQTKWPSLKRRLDKVTAELDAVEDKVTEVEQPLSERLSLEGRTLLIAACEDHDQPGTLIDGARMRGTSVQAGSKEFGESEKPRSMATWVAALEELEVFGLIRAMEPGGEVYEVLKRGWDVYDLIEPDQSGT